MTNKSIEPTKVIPGDDLNLTLLMAPMSLNMVTGQDRKALLEYGRAVWQASRKQAIKEVAKFTELEFFLCEKAPPRLLANQIRGLK